jgi:hypothetical protein
MEFDSTKPMPVCANNGIDVMPKGWTVSDPPARRRLLTDRGQFGCPHTAAAFATPALAEEVGVGVGPVGAGATVGQPRITTGTGTALLRRKTRTVLAARRLFTTKTKTKRPRLIEAFFSMLNHLCPCIGLCHAGYSIRCVVRSRPENNV